MEIINNLFIRMSTFYTSTFAEWMHVHYLLRTVILLLIVWLVLYLAANAFRLVVGPILLFFCYHLLFRAFNYLILETAQEWLFIKYHSKGSKRFARSYVRLTDTVYQNRKTLKSLTYLTLCGKAWNGVFSLMVACMVSASLFVTALGLTIEFTDIYREREVVSGPIQNIPPAIHPSITVPIELPSMEEPDEIPVSVFEPPTWAIEPGINLVLTEEGSAGTRLRDGPGIDEFTVIEILWGDVVLEYIGNFEADEAEGLFWMQVLTPVGNVGWVSHVLLDRQ